MRILYLQTFPFWGSGSGTYARHLASEIGKKHKVAILAPDDRLIERTRLYSIKMPFNVAFTGHPEWPNCKLYTELTNQELLDIHETFFRATVKAVEDFKPDIIHVHHAFPLTWAAAFIKDTYGINFVTTIHGSELPTLEKDKRYVRFTYDAMFRTKKIVPNSGWTREWFLKIFKGYFHEKCRTIPGGVNIDKFAYTESGARKVDRDLNLHGKPVVVFAGKLTKYKGVDYLINAARKLHGEVVILGDGPERKKLEQKTKELNLNNVHFVGHLGAGIAKLVPYYSRADVFVAPSVWDEPLGLVILESMACQTPVVVTRKGGIPLAVKEGYNGLFIRPRNSTEIVAKVNMLLDDENLRHKMGQNARKSVEKKFSWEIIAHRFENMYEKFRKRNKVSPNIKKYDVILTLGNGFSDNWKLPDIVISRLKYIADLYSRGVSNKIIVAGGWSINWDLNGIKPPTTEAENMKKVLVDLKVSPQNILKEEWSRDTMGNAYFSKIKIIIPNKFKNILVICSDFHLKRVKFLFEKIFESGFNIDYKTTSTGKMYDQDIIRIEEDVLSRQKKFLEKMKRGDDRFLKPRLYEDSYYKEKRSKEIAKIAMRGIK